MILNINFTKEVFTELKPQISDELAARFSGTIDLLTYWHIAPLDDISIYFRLYPEGDFVSTSDNTYSAFMSIMSVNFEDRMVECLMNPEKLECVKQYFAI